MKKYLLYGLLTVGAVGIITISYRLADTSSDSVDLDTVAPSSTMPVPITASIPSTGKLTPSITSFTPIQGSVGQTVIITGKNLDQVKGLRFGADGTPATYTVLSQTSLKTTVPYKAKSGKITLLSSEGLAQSGATFTVTIPSSTSSLSTEPTSTSTSSSEASTSSETPMQSFINMQNQNENNWNCPADEMQCSDGSTVGRTGPNCQFACPYSGQ